MQWRNHSPHARSSAIDAAPRGLPLPDGTVQCWGDNEGGQLGDGSTALMRTTPGSVPGLSGVVRLAAGDEFTCAQHADGSLACWGRVSEGASILATPTPVPGVANVQTFDAGHSGVCIVLMDHSLVCWRGIGVPVSVAF